MCLLLLFGIRKAKIKADSDESITEKNKKVKKMDLLQLKYFNTVAATQNMMKASKILHVSQPAISKNIAKLEEEIGCKLFTRNGKNIQLNPAGAKFLECSNSAVELIENGIEEMSLFGGDIEQRIHVGIAGSCSRMSECIAEYSSKHSNAIFDINGNIWNEEKPDINEYDVIVYPDTSAYAKYNGYPLYVERYYLALTTSHPLANKTKIEISDLNQLDVVYLRHAKSVEHIHRTIKALGINFNKTYYVNTRELHLQMITEKLAAGFVPEGAAKMYIKETGIRLVPITDDRFYRQVNIAFKRDKHLSESAKEFKEYTIKYFKIEES